MHILFPLPDFSYVYYLKFVKETENVAFQVEKHYLTYLLLRFFYNMVRCYITANQSQGRCVANHLPERRFTMQPQKQSSINTVEYIPINASVSSLLEKKDGWKKRNFAIQPPARSLLHYFKKQL